MTIEVKVERDNVNDEFVVVKKLHRYDGNSVTMDELVLEVETSKTAVEIRSPASGVLGIAVREEDEVPVGATLFNIRPHAEERGPRGSATTGVAAATGEAATATAPAGSKVSHSAEMLALQLGVDLRQIRSSGWITAADVLAVVRPAEVRDEEIRANGSGQPPKAPYRPERISSSKRAEARNLARGNSSGSTSMIGIDVTLCGPRLVPPPYMFIDSISDLIVFEAARLLGKYRELNACRIDQRTIGYFEEVNFGISFDAGRALKVLALRQADTLCLGAIQAGIEELLQLYESASAIPPDLLQSSTVTLSDLSRSDGADYMFPLLNAQQSLTLGITRCSSGQTRASFRLYASFDHRVSEGLQVSSFLAELRGRVQSHHRPAEADSRAAHGLRCGSCDQTLASELRSGGRGLLRIIAADGKEGWLCRNCFQGWS